LDQQERSLFACAIDDQGRLVSGRKRRLGFWGWCSVSVVLLFVVVLAGAGFFTWTVLRDRNSAFLREHFVSVLKSGLGPGNELMLDEAGMRMAGSSPTFSIAGLAITNPGTGAYAELERADFRLTRASLWRLSPEARAIRFEGLKLVLPAARESDSPLAANEALTLLRATLGAVNFAVSGQDPAFRTLDTIEGTNISIFQRGKGGETTLIQTGMTATVTRQGEGITARIERPGAPRAIEFAARTEADASGAKTISLDSGELSAADLFGLFGHSVQGIDPGLRLSLRLRSTTDAAGAPGDTSVSLTAHGGRIEPPDRDMPPFVLDEAAVDLRMKPGESDVIIDRLQVRFNETNILAHGRLNPVDGAEPGIRVELKTDRADIDRLSATEPVMRLDSVAIEGLIAGSLRTFTLTKLDLAEGAARLNLSGKFSTEGSGLIETALEASGFDLREALRIWPVWVAPNVRTWLVRHADGGRLDQLSLKSNLFGEALYNAFHHLPIPDEALNITYAMSGVTLRPVEGALPITGISAKGLSTGRRAEIDIAGGQIEAKPGQVFDLRNARLTVPDTSKRPAMLEIATAAGGQLGALITFLQSPKLKEASGLPTDLSVTAGRFDGDAKITLPLATTTAAKDIRVDVKADLTDVAVDNIVHGEKLEAGKFQLVSAAGQLSLKGEATIFGVPNRIEVRSQPGKPASAMLKVNLDEAQLAKRGIDFRPMATGPVAATVTIPLGGNAPAEIDLDLAKMKIEAAAMGIAKRVGQPGRVKFALVNRPDGVVLDGFEADIGAVSARGKIELQKDNQLAKAELSSIRLSPGDNARLSVERNRGVLKVVLRGNSFDVRPFLRGKQAGMDDAKPDGKSPDADVDIQTTVLVGFNGELLSAAEVKSSRRGGRTTALAIKGRFGAAALNVATVAQEGDLSRIAVETLDGGALARFLDIYPRAHGGHLRADLRIGARSERGVVNMRNFIIRGESGLRQVSSTAAQGQKLPEIGDEARFTTLKATFSRVGGKLTLDEAVMWGNEVGGSIEGEIDYARDRVSLKGAFVPAYALNNLFARVPIFGLLMGGQNEGLFAVPFVITGKASAPLLRTNPVSVIAPGFLRKFFEIQRESN
jgi:hypothetical protein